MQQLQSPLVVLSSRCKLPLTLPQVLGLMQAAQTKRPHWPLQRCQADPGGFARSDTDGTGPDPSWRLRAGPAQPSRGGHPRVGPAARALGRCDGIADRTADDPQERRMPRSRPAGSGFLGTRSAQGKKVVPDSA
jgi:hypothetical protein